MSARLDGCPRGCTGTLSMLRMPAAVNAVAPTSCCCQADHPADGRAHLVKSERLRHRQARAVVPIEVVLQSQGDC
jgi:hypothetical protein